MTNKISIYLIVLMLISLIQYSYGQTINNDFNIKLGYNNCQLSGSDNYINNYSLNPSLLSNNLNSGNIYFGVDYKYSEIVSINLDITNSSFNSWSYEGNFHNYSNNNCSNLALKPGIIVRTRHKYYGFLNQVKVYSKLAPTFNLLNINGHHTLNLAVDDSDLETDITISELQFGIDISAGISYSFSNSIAIFFEYGLNTISIKQQIFEEDYLLNRYFNVGLEFKLFKNKRIYY